MGLSASQARFLQLTARKSNVEYEMQRISHERVRLSDMLKIETDEYQKKMNNKTMLYNHIGEDGKKTDMALTYKNFTDLMNKDLPGVPKHYLVSSSGNSLMAASREDAITMIENAAKDGIELDLADFIIDEEMNDPDKFQQALRDGTVYIANYDAKENKFTAQDWETLDGGAVVEVYDTSDDAAAQAKYDAAKSEYQSYDKKLEMILNQLESDRSAIKTEMEAVQKTIDENIENTYNIFG